MAANPTRLGPDERLSTDLRIIPNHGTRAFYTVSINGGLLWNVAMATTSYGRQKVIQEANEDRQGADTVEWLVQPEPVRLTGRAGGQQIALEAYRDGITEQEYMYALYKPH